MDEFWHALLANLAVVATVFALWTLAQDWLHRYRRPVRHFALGTAMGLSAIGTMVLAVDEVPGVMLDLRAAPLAIAGLFGGPLAAVLAAAFAVVFRLSTGGVGMVAGLVSIGAVVLVGVVTHLRLNGRRPEPVHILVVAAGVAVVGFVTTQALPSATLHQMAIPTATLIFVATVLAGFVVARGEARSAERDLLSSALSRSPEYLYVKDKSGRFVVANLNVAHNAGYSTVAELVGKTDFDLVDEKRAAELFDAEQHILRTGKPIVGLKERITDRYGRSRWFLTTKVPLHNPDGEPIGIGGMTTDITEQQRLEAALVDSRNLLAYAVNEMSDGLAMFDRDGHLVYCNERYREIFPLTVDARRPGAHIRDILQSAVDAGELVNLDDAESWVQTAAASLQTPTEEQVRLFDGRWLLVRTRPTEEGAAMVVVSDITSIKKAEGELRDLTSELKVLAETDGLTGLMNRRSFDMRFADELDRSAAERRPLSLIIFDVDWFKSYNDTLGHQAGDECLRLVARSLKAALLRSDDFGARYGGEEFVAILPDTEEEDAFIVAERARTALADLKLPHPTAHSGFVSLSAGIASYGANDMRRSASQLLSRADQALYEAKAAGRNRVASWRPRDPAKMTG